MVSLVVVDGCVAELYFRLERLRSWSGQHQQSLAGFEKIRTVGKGAYGAAVLYKKKDDDSLVILKEINMHDLTAAERQLALNEVRVLAMLDHPNIISYFDSFEEDGVLMIEMEYADGGTLAQYLSQQDASVGSDREREVLTMFQQIVAAIRHIHEHNILHRDLKTDNIFLTKEGVVKVGDFGISKMLGSANKGAQTVLGTPYYISPEMLMSKFEDPNSDPEDELMASAESISRRAKIRACCGDGFSVFGSDNGLVLTCGDGSTGCLGHGDWAQALKPRLIEALLSCQPMRVQIEEPVVFRDVKCGVDGTMFLTDMGGVFACGSNQHNKLGLNNRQGFLMAMKNIFTKLGTGNVKATHAPMELKSLSDKSVNHVQCGDHFSVASTRDHQLYYWGLRYTAAQPRHSTAETMARRSLSAGSRDNGKEKDRDKEKEIGRDDSVILLEPVEIIRIKQANEKVLLGNVFCHGENLFIQVETTAPPPRRRTFKKRSFRRRPYGTSDLSRDPKQLSASSHEAGDEYSSEASEIDSQTTVPTWLRDELSGEIEDVPRCHDNDDDGNEADDTSDLTDDDSHTHVMIDSSMSSIQINRCELELMREEKKRAETELQALQRERELQAVRVRQEAERLAKEREEELRGQVEALRRELEKQSLHLEDHQRLVGHLQNSVGDRSQ
nr:hypothetical protein BaRGS_031495 [Batillaria attramentaria]